jgi:anaerobic selenocysteine-containing dehydrogenase
MKRRDFLKVGGTAGAGSLLLQGCGSPEQQLIPLLVSEDQFYPGDEGWVPSLCQMCPAGCGINVRVTQGETVRTVEGRTVRVKAVQAKKIEGNPKHPLNLGKTCARGQAGLQLLYNPDRLQGPQRLSGARGSGEFTPIDWTEGIRLLIEKFQELQRAPESVAFLSGSTPRGTWATLLERFAGAYGTPNLISYDALDPAPIRRAFELTTGLARLPIVDFEHANYLLSIGANLFETFLSPVRYNRAYGQMRQGRPGVRGKFVQAEPRLSSTAANADEWLPIAPGTEGLLALAIAQVIVEESLYDREFIAQSTAGFAEWSHALAEFAPAAVAEQIDVPADTIVRIAREFAARRPSVAVADSRDVSALVAVNALNALVGAYGRRGGILFDSLPAEQAPAAPAPPRSGAAGSPQEARRDILQLMEVVAANPNAIRALVLVDANPLFLLPEAEQLRATFERIPFIVSLSPFMDETTAMADLILPGHTYLERWRDDVPEPGTGLAIRTLAQPVVEPRFDTRDAADVLLEVARALGGKVAEALPSEDFASMVRESFAPLQALKRGSAVNDTFDGFWETVTADGGWWDADAQSAASPGGQARKFQFPSTRPLLPPPALDGDAGQFPFVLHVYPSLAFRDGSAANLPWLQELPDPMTTVMWGSWVEINPETAGRLGVAQGDLLTVRSANGSLELPVYVYPGLRPDVLAIPFGQGHQAYGRYATNRGSNPLRLLASTFDAAAGCVVQRRTRVAASAAGRRGSLVTFGSSEPHHGELPAHR